MNHDMDKWNFIQSTKRPIWMCRLVLPSVSISRQSSLGVSLILLTSQPAAGAKSSLGRSWQYFVMFTCRRGSLSVSVVRHWLAGLWQKAETSDTLPATQSPPHCAISYRYTNIYEHWQLSAGIYFSLSSFSLQTVWNYAPPKI